MPQPAERLRALDPKRRSNRFIGSTPVRASKNTRNVAARSWAFSNRNRVALEKSGMLEG